MIAACAHRALRGHAFGCASKVRLE